jgi:phosphoserine phosphatase
VRTERPPEVVARIEEAALSAPAGVVATDADGTLWSGDVGDDLFHAFIERGRVEPPALAAMRAEARAFGVDDGGDGSTLARRIFDAYLAGRFSDERIFELMAWCFAGWTRGEVDAFAREVAAKIGLASRMHGELLEVLDGVRRADIEVVVVSASPIAIVQAALAVVEVSASDVVAALPCFEGDVVTPAAERPIPYGPGKVARLRERIGTRPLYAAFGDNAFDVSLLREARIPVAVRPKPKLRDRAGEVESLVELARQPRSA